MVAQTTFNTSEWQKCVKTAKKLYTNLKIFDTICKATLMRQTEAAQLAEVSDIMIVIGGRHSSNTGKLADICSRCCKTIWVETARELLSGQADEVCQIGAGSRIGVTAGASTPVRIIKEVQKTMSEILKEEEMSFEEMLDQSFKSTYTGEKVNGYRYRHCSERDHCRYRYKTHRLCAAVRADQTTQACQAGRHRQEGRRNRADRYARQRRGGHCHALQETSGCTGRL